MDFLSNPNIAYLLLVITTFLVLAAIAVPGTGIPEIAALFGLVLSGYAVYHLSFNCWPSCCSAWCHSFLLFEGRAARYGWRFPSLA
jgi:membrane-bound ClpP family serine protease